MGQLLSLALSLVGRVRWLALRSSTAQDPDDPACRTSIATSSNPDAYNIAYQESDDDTVPTGRILRSPDVPATPDDFLKSLAYRGIINHDAVGVKVTRPQQVSAPRSTNRPIINYNYRSSLATQGIAQAIINNYRNSLAAPLEPGSRMRPRTLIPVEEICRTHLRSSGFEEADNQSEGGSTVTLTSRDLRGLDESTDTDTAMWQPDIKPATALTDAGLRQPNRHQPETKNKLMSKGIAVNDATCSRQPNKQPVTNDISLGTERQTKKQLGTERQTNKQPIANEVSLISRGKLGTERPTNKQPVPNDVSLISRGKVGAERQTNKQPVTNDVSLISRGKLGTERPTNKQLVPNDVSLISRGKVQDTSSRQSNMKNQLANDLKSSLMSKITVGRDQSTRKVNADDFLDILESTGIIEPEPGARRRGRSTLEDLPSITLIETETTDLLGSSNSLTSVGTFRKHTATPEDFLDILAGEKICNSEDYVEKLANQEMTDKDLRAIKHTRPVVEPEMIEKLLSDENLGTDFGVPGFAGRASTNNNMAVYYNAEIPSGISRIRPLAMDAVNKESGREVSRTKALAMNSANSRQERRISRESVDKASKNSFRRDSSTYQARRNTPVTPERLSGSRAKTSVSRETTGSNPRSLTADEFLKRLVGAGILERGQALPTSSQHSMGAKGVKADAFVTNLDTLLSEGALDVGGENRTSSADQYVGQLVKKEALSEDKRPITGDDFVKKLVNTGVLEPDMDAHKRFKLVTAMDSVFKEMTKRLSNTPITDTSGGPSGSRQ